MGHLTPGHLQSALQFGRFVIAGMIVTVVSLAAYATVAIVLRRHPQFGNLAAYLVAIVTGYVVHSRWSFRAHGTRGHATRVRFVAVSVVTYAMNSFWVWLVYSRLHLGRAAPIVPMTLVTPAVTFALSRVWVFR